MLDIQRIKNTLEYARLWEYDLTVFGSTGHLYCLNTTVEENALAAWETTHGLTLPQDYRDYLTKLGNGFAGPDYGIKSFDLDTFKEEWKEPCLHAPEYEEEYDRLAKEIAAWYNSENEEDEEDEEDEDDPYDAWEKRFNLDGVLTIGTGGCEGINAIALNGSTRGFYLSLVDDLEYYRAGEMGRYDKPFSQWLMEWLEKVERACSQLTQAQLDRAKWEREWMLGFAEYWREKNERELARLVSELEGREFISTKCAGFVYYFRPKKRRHLPGAEGLEHLRQRMGEIADRNRKTILPHIFHPGEARYAVAWCPTLEEFVKHL